MFDSDKAAFTQACVSRTHEKLGIANFNLAKANCVPLGRTPGIEVMPSEDRTDRPPFGCMLIPVSVGIPHFTCTVHVPSSYSYISWHLI